jgi:hypothetical protein
MDMDVVISLSLGSVAEPKEDITSAAQYKIGLNPHCWSKALVARLVIRNVELPGLGPQDELV